MDNRFRREKNLAHASKKTSSQNNPPPHSDKKTAKDPSSFVVNFLDSYKKIRKYHVVRDTILLAAALFCVLVIISWVLPRVFSFHFDSTNILSIFNPETSTGTQEDEAGDMDVLILGRGGNENDAPNLTDSIILGHYNKDHNSFTTVSIPRDLLIQSKILGRVKINEVYAGGKGSL